MRLRADGHSTKALRQEMYDLFQEDVEVRVRQQVSVRLRKTLEELEKDFYGSALAMDEVRLPLLLPATHSATVHSVDSN